MPRDRHEHRRSPEEWAAIRAQEVADEEARVAAGREFDQVCKNSQLAGDWFEIENTIEGWRDNGKGPTDTLKEAVSSLRSIPKEIRFKDLEMIQNSKYHNARLKYNWSDQDGERQYRIDHSSHRGKYYCVVTVCYPPLPELAGRICVGQRVEVLYEGDWYSGRALAEVKDGLWRIQCDADDEGEVTEAHWTDIRDSDEPAPGEYILVSHILCLCHVIMCLMLISYVTPLMSYHIN